MTRSKILQRRYRQGEWYTTTQEWQWTAIGEVLINQSGGRYEVREGELRQSYKITTEREALPVKVTMRGDRVKKVQARHHEAEEQAGTCFPNFLRAHDTIDCRYKRLMGHVMPTSAVPVIENKAKAFVAVADGSVKNGRGSAACVLHTTDAGRGVVRTRVPVDGRSTKLTSYRAELAGLLAALLLITCTTYSGHLVWLAMTQALSVAVASTSSGLDMG